MDPFEKSSNGFFLSLNNNHNFRPRTGQRIIYENFRDQLIHKTLFL